MISIDSCMIIHYNVEENIFVAIVYTLIVTVFVYKHHIKQIND